MIESSKYRSERLPLTSLQGMHLLALAELGETAEACLDGIPPKFVRIWQELLTDPYAVMRFDPRTVFRTVGAISKHLSTAHIQRMISRNDGTPDWGGPWYHECLKSNIYRVYCEAVIQDVANIKG